METLKKYWPIFLLLPVVAYIAFTIWKDSQSKNESIAKAREAKAEKALLRKLDEKEIDEESKASIDGTNN